MVEYRSLSPSGPGSFPGPVSFRGSFFFRGLASTVRQMSEKVRHQSSPDIIGRHNHKKIFITDAKVDAPWNLTYSIRYYYSLQYIYLKRSVVKNIRRKYVLFFAPQNMTTLASEALISAWGSFTCRRSTTRDPRLYFSSKGSHIQNFYALKKIHRPRPNPRTSDPEASMITPRPPEST